MLSIKGREPFIRMQLWLNDANNVERLQLLKNERREAIKRRRSTGAGGHDNSSDTSSNDTSEFYHSNSPGPASVTSQTAPPNKKQRVLFSEEQKEALRLAFALDPYPNVQTIEFLANELNLSTRTITNWFHNHRMRLKQQVPHGQPSEPIPSRENQSGAPFDPVQFRILLNQRLMEIQKERMGLSGMPLPYPPYFGANPNLAALISRGLLSSEADLQALNNAVKEQMMGLDLSMTSLKREVDMDYDDLDNDNDNDNENEGDNDGGDNESRLSETESISDGASQRHNNNNDQMKDLSPPPQAISRTSRRKPAAPQWVNPDWRDDSKKTNIPAEKEVIINGVCVMNQSSDFDQSEADKQEETEDETKTTNIDEEDDAESENQIKKSFIKKPTPPESESAAEDNKKADLDDVSVKKEVEAGNWEY
jgi:homeobox protein cut-like